MRDRSQTLNNSSYKVIWDIVSYASIDNIAAQLSILPFFFIFAESSIVTLLFLLITHGVIVLCKKKTPYLLISFIRVNFYLTSELFFMPFSLIQVIVLKYSYSNYAVIQEYFEEIPSSQVNYKAYGVITILILLFLNFLLSLLYTGFSFDIRHFSNSKSLKSKSNINMALLLKSIKFVLICSYPIFHISYHYQFLLVISAYSLLGLVYKTFKLSFYNSFMNYLAILHYLESASISLSFLLAYHQSNPSIAFILSLFLQPAILIISKELVEWRTRSIPPMPDLSSFSSFELSNRSYFLGQVPPFNLLKLSNLSYSIHKNSLMLIIQSCYCLDVLKNNALASVKLAKASANSFSIFSKFQIFKLRELLKASGYSELHSVKVCKFVESQCLALKTDREYCEVMVELINKISEKSSKKQNIEQLVLKSCEKLKKAKFYYEALVKEYPECSQVNRLYGSFLVELGGKRGIGQMYLDKTEQRSNRKQLRDKQDKVFHDESVCILIFSGDKETLGKIVHANAALCTYLEIDLQEVLALNVRDLVPEHRDFDLFRYLVNFIDNSKSQFLFQNQVLFLKNSKGFIKPCKCTVECVGIDSNIQLVAIIHVRNYTGRESALAYDDGTIIAHSQGFPEKIGTNFNRIESFNINYFIDDLFCEQLKQNDLFLKIDYKNRILKIFQRFVFKGISVIILSFTSNINDLKKFDNSGEISAILNHHSRKKNMTRIIKENEQNNIKMVSLEVTDNLNNKQIKENETVKAEEKNTNTTSNLGKGSFKESFENKYIEKSLKHFKVLKIIVMIFSLIIIVSIIAVIITTINNISVTQSLDTILIVGKLGYDYSKLGLYFRVLDLSKRFKIPPAFSVDDIEGILNDLDEIKLELIKAKEYLNFCATSDFIEEKLMIERTIPDLSTSNLINLLDSIEHNSLHARNLLNQLNESNIADTTSFCFVIFNCYKIQAEQIQSLIYKISECEGIRLNYLNRVVWIIIYCWIAFLVLVYLFIIVFIFNINKKINKIWNLYWKKLKTCSTLKSKLINRLQTTHNFAYVDNYETDNKKVDQLRYNYWSSYIIIVSFLIFIALALILAFGYGFYNQINNSLIFRKHFIQTPLNQRIAITRHGFNVVNKMSKNFSLTTLCNTKSVTVGYISEFNKTRNMIFNLIHEVTGNEILRNTPLNIWKQMYDSFENSDDFIRYGINSALYYIEQESSLYWDNVGLYSLANISQYLSDLDDLGNSFETILNTTDSDTMNIVNQNLRTLYIFSVISIVLIIALSLVIYGLYFKREVEIINKIRKSISLFFELQENS